MSGAEESDDVGKASASEGSVTAEATPFGCCCCWSWALIILTVSQPVSRPASWIGEGSAVVEAGQSRAILSAGGRPELVVVLHNGLFGEIRNVKPLRGESEM